jgi:phosphate:Na+ symporter
MANGVTRLLPSPQMVPDRRTPFHLDPSALDMPSEALGCAMREALNLGDVGLDMQAPLPQCKS